MDGDVETKMECEARGRRPRGCRALLLTTLLAALVLVAPDYAFAQAMGETEGAQPAAERPVGRRVSGQTIIQQEIAPWLAPAPQAPTTSGRKATAQRIVEVGPVAPQPPPAAPIPFQAPTPLDLGAGITVAAPSWTIPNTTTSSGVPLPAGVSDAIEAGTNDGGASSGGSVAELRVDKPADAGVTPSATPTVPEGINVRDFGAKGDSQTDDTDAVARAIEACPPGGKLFFPLGRYVAAIKIQKPIRVDFMGSTIVPPDSRTNIINVLGQRDAKGFKLAVPVKRGDRVLRLANFPENIAAGDLIVLRDDSVRPSDGQKDNNLEVHQISIADYTNNELTLEDIVRLPKAVAGENVYRIRTVNDVAIENVNLEAAPNATGNMGINVDMGKGVTLSNVKMTQSVGACVRFMRSFACALDRFAFSDPQATGSGQGYGILTFGGSTRIAISNGEGVGMRHVVDCGNSFDVVAQNVTALNSASSSFVMSHNGFDSDIEFRQCRSVGGTSYAFNTGALGSTNPYDLTVYNLRLIDCEASIDESSFTVGIYFQTPTKDFLIENAKLTYGNGQPQVTSNTFGIRMPNWNNSGLIRNTEIAGFKIGVFQYDDLKQRPANDESVVRYETVNVTRPVIGLYIGNRRLSDLSGVNVTSAGSKDVVFIAP